MYQIGIPEIIKITAEGLPDLKIKKNSQKGDRA